MWKKICIAEFFTYKTEVSKISEKTIFFSGRVNIKHCLIEKKKTT